MNDPAAPEPATSARCQRIAVTFLFVTLGLLVGSWLSRTPDVKGRIGLSDHAWGLLATAGSVGAITALLGSGLLLRRIGGRRMLFVAAPGLLIVAPLLASAHGVPHLITAILLWGLVSSLLQAPMNSAGVKVEARYGRPIMNALHAGFSVGTLAGALLGALAIRGHVAPEVQMVLTSAALGAAFGVILRWLPADPPPPAAPRADAAATDPDAQEGSGSPAPARVRGGFLFTRPILLLSAIGFCSIIAESTSAQWAAIYVAEALGAGGAAGALAYACFVGAMMVGRIGGDRVVHALGRRRFLRTAPAVAAGGVLIAVAGGTPAAAFVGFVLVGLGVSCVTPTVYGAAGTLRDVPTGPALATISLIMWPGFLAGPVIVGTVADTASLRVALLVIAVAALTVTLLAAGVRTPRTAS